MSAVVSHRGHATPVHSRFRAARLSVPVLQGCPPDGPVGEEIRQMSGSGKREERRHTVCTVLAVVRFVLWIVWMLLDPRHLI